MKLLKKHILLFIFSLSLFHFLAAQPLSLQQKQAIAFLSGVGDLKQSSNWPNVKPAAFFKNLRKNITQPLFVYAGNNTNFCGFAAISYTWIGNSPLNYAKFMVELYSKGESNLKDEYFNPSLAVKKEAGLLKFKGELDINQADQLLFLSLADHFKGYINFFSPNFHTGSEDKLWAATNFAKFNRMLKKIVGYNVHAVGSDLLRPSIKDIPKFLNKKIQENDEVFLYLNNSILHKKDHNKIRTRIPTHFVVLQNISENNGMVTLTYWDYGFKTLQQLPIKIVKKILFGVTWCKKKSTT